MPGSSSMNPDRALIEQVIETQIRPLLRIHGGDIELVQITGGEIELEFEGACRACALKSVTYAVGVRERLRHLPGVHAVKVRGVNLSDAAITRVSQAYSSHPLLLPQEVGHFKTLTTGHGV